MKYFNTTKGSVQRQFRQGNNSTLPSLRYKMYKTETYLVCGVRRPSAGIKHPDVKPSIRYGLYEGQQKVVGVCLRMSVGPLSASLYGSVHLCSTGFTLSWVLMMFACVCPFLPVAYFRAAALKHLKASSFLIQPQRNKPTACDLIPNLHCVLCTDNKSRRRYGYKEV